MTLKKSVRTKKKDPAIVFELFAEKLKGRKPVRYSMSGSFKANDVIDHDTFGIGIVISSTYTKMEVVFPDKIRMLVCNR